MFNGIIKFDDYNTTTIRFAKKIHDNAVSYLGQRRSGDRIKMPDALQVLFDVSAVVGNT